MSQSLEMSTHLMQELLPIGNKEAVFGLVSSIYAGKPAAQFSHYIAAKRALEALWGTLAVEFPRLKFLVARPPVMLTDQTNLPFMPNPPLPPLEAGSRLLDFIDGEAFKTSNHKIFEGFA